METGEDQSASASQSISPRVASAQWVLTVLTLLVPLSLLAVGGFLMGTVEGDIPWPATPQEASVYYTARDLSWVAVVLAIIGSVSVGVASYRQPIGFRVIWAVFTFAATAVLGGIVFFAAYAFGNEHYFSAFS